MNRRREMLALWLIMALGLGIRLAYLAENRANPDFELPAVDAGYHDYWARALVTGDWSRRGMVEYDPDIPRQPYFRPPGYPYFLALVYRICGLGYGAPRLAQIALGLLNIWLLYGLARRLFGPLAALAAAALMASYWLLVYFEGEFLEPVLLITLTLLLLRALAAFLEAPRYGLAGLSGLLLAAAALVRPTALPFALFVAGWLWWVAGRGWRGCALAAVFGAACAAGLLPTALRNYIVGRDRVLISANMGINLYIGNNPLANGGFVNIGDGAGGQFQTSDAYPVIMQRLARRVGRPLKYSEASRYFANQALGFIRAYPVRFFQLLAIKTILFWGPYEAGHNKYLYYERAYSPLLRRLPFNFPFVLTLTLLGALLAIPIRHAGAQPAAAPATDPAHRRMVALLLAYLAFQYASFLPFFVTGQYRAPVLPVLFVFAGGSVARIAELWRRRDWRWLGAAGLAGLVLYGVLTRDYLNVKLNPSAWHQARGQAWARAERPELAAAEYRAALTADPDNAEAHYNLANALTKMGRPAAAREHLLAALRLRPDFGRAAFNLATALEMAGDRAGAIARMREAAGLMPDFAPARIQLGNLLLQAGNAAGARAEIETGLQLDPRSELGWRALAQTHKVGRDRAAFIRTLREAVRACPESVGLLNSLAWALATDPASSDEAAREGLRLAERCVERDPDNPAALDTLAAAQARVGRYAAAERQARRALELAQQAGLTNAAPQVEARRRLFAAGQPYLEPELE